VKFLYRDIVTKPSQPMTNSQYRRLKDLLVAVCERATALEERGDVLKGHAELMEALATYMPELNADLREYEESLHRGALDPIQAIA